MEGFDIGIIGCGIAGTFAALKISEKHPEAKIILFDIGRPPAKRRRPLEGFLGCFPTGNGRIYPNNLDDLQFIDGRKVHAANQWALDYFKKVNPMKLIKDRNPHKSLENTIQELGFTTTLNDYYQWKPEHVHKLSRIVTKSLEDAPNVFFSFDNEVKNIIKEKDSFKVISEGGDIECSKIILCAGRSGWRWVSDLYKQFGITTEDKYAKYGVRIEMPAQKAKDLNKSHCTLSKNDIELGPFYWNGSIIPEDHADVVLSSFRSNEDRWRSEKLSFSLLKTIECGDGVKQTDRIGKLTYLLYNDRVNKEKFKTFMKGNSIISILPEYLWLKEYAEELTKLFPDVYNYGSMYLPHIYPMASKISLDKQMQTAIGGLYVAGESANIKGILGAAVSGCIVANEICRDADDTDGIIKANIPNINDTKNIINDIKEYLLKKIIKFNVPTSMDKIIKGIKVLKGTHAKKREFLSQAIKSGSIDGFSIRRGRNGGIFRTQ